MDPVVDRYKSMTEVVSTGRRFARTTARALAELVASELEEGKPLPDFTYEQRLFAAVLERKWGVLGDADEALSDVLGQRQALIGTRDREREALYREVVDLRLVLRSRFGTEPSKRFIGLRGPTSRDPVALQRQADRAVTRLRAPNRPLPAAKRPVTEATRRRWAAAVAESADALRVTVVRVADTAKEVDFVRLERQRALADFNDAFVTVAGWFESVYRLIGRHDLADVVRPSRQHPGWLHREEKKRGRRRSGSKKTPASVLSFESLRRAWRQMPGRRQAG